MSNKNHKNHVNYNKMSTTPNTVVDTANVETPSIPANREIKNDDTQTTPVVQTPTPVEPIDGTVSGCLRLNVRKEPSLTGEVVCEVSVGTTLMIDSDKSTEEWFKVYTETGVEGYCMKKFVTIKS